MDTFVYTYISSMENHGICSRCGQAVKHENLILIYGKYYGPDCAERVLGVKQIPSWFRGGDWAEAKAKHEVDMEALIKDANERRQSMRENWDFVKKFSEAYHRERKYLESTGKEWSVNFMADMARKHGIQMAKEDARNFDTYEAYEVATNHIEKFVVPQLSEKQQALLDKLL